MKPEIGMVLRDAGAMVLPAPRADRWLKMLCPFHEDRQPSASVNYSRDRFRCHTCGVAGDSIDLAMRVYGCSFRQALDVYKVSRESRVASQAARNQARVRPRTQAKPMYTRREIVR